MRRKVDDDAFGEERSLSVRAIRHLWRNYLNGPLYIPPQGRELISILHADGPSCLVEELQRRSSLGSPWASAALGYLSLMPGVEGKRNTARAIQLCKSHAEAGDPYSLFVFAWAKFWEGDHDAALEAMTKSAVRHFPPAALDLTTLVWEGSKRSDPSRALRMLRYADLTHHKAALIWRCRLYRSGSFGLLRRILGYGLTPIAKLRYRIALLFDPFSPRVFLFQSSATAPLFRRY